MSTAIAFFPWISVAERIEVGSVRLLPFAPGDSPGDQNDVEQRDIDAVLGAYANRPNRPVRSAVLLEVDNWRSGMEVDDAQMDKLFDAATILTFSALARRILFQNSFGYINSHSYQLVIQRFVQGQAGDFVFTARRRDGFSRHYWSNNEFAFHRPSHVPDRATVSLDEPVAKALLQLPAHDPVLQGVKAFVAANTDSGDIPNHVEIVMAKSAFEWLLKIKSQKGEFLRKLGAMMPRQLGGKVETPLRGRWLTHWTPTGDRLLLAWASDFCALRGEAAHGSKGAPVLWDASKHMAFCAVLFPLIVKLVLAQRQLLNLTEEDLAAIDHVEEYLLYDPFESTDPDVFVSAWSGVHNRMRRRILAQRLYGIARASAVESLASE
jgi:hypothetical protein